MNASINCLSKEQIAELVRRPLPEGQAEELARHLEQCTACATTVEALLSKDTMIDAMRVGSRLAGSKPPSVSQDLIARLRALKPAAGEATLPPVAVPSQDTINPVPIEAGDEAPSFLAPARGSGELGWLGSFRVLKQLGAGGMGMVFLAEDTKLERHVALKVMRPELARPEQKQRFLREARAAAKVKHDHVVTIYQVGEEGTVPFLAMDLLEGESLDDWLKRGQKANPAAICRIGREVAEGLAAAHASGLIHRDIKPGNIWLEKRGQAHGKPSVGLWRIKILDFGLARATEGQEQLTSQGVIVGTPAYAAPEQFRGEAEQRSDLFSLGAVLYRLCTGRLPFKGNDVLSIVASVSLDTPAGIGEVNPDVPSALADLVMQLLAKDAKDRPASARDVANRLAAIERELLRAKRQPAQATMAGEPGVSIPGLKSSQTEHIASDPARLHPGVNTPGSPKKRRRVAIAAGFAAALVLALGTVVIIRDKAGRKIAEIEVPDGGSVEVKPLGDGSRGLNGDWDGGADWGRIRLGGGPDQFAGTYSATFNGRPGSVELKRVKEDRYEGSWSESDKRRFGTLTLVLYADNERARIEWKAVGGSLPGQMAGSSVASRSTGTAPTHVRTGSPFPPLDPAWVKRVQTLPPEEQVKEVAAELKRRNPKFDGKVGQHIEQGAVVRFTVNADNLTDLSPVRALTRLSVLSCSGTATAKGILADLSPLRGMSLTELHCAHTPVRDLSPLRGMKLVAMDFQRSAVEDLSPLVGMPLERLAFQYVPVRDLSHLKGMPLQMLDCSKTRVTDLSPLKGLPIRNLYCDYKPERDAALLQSIKTLEMLNGKAAAVILKSNPSPETISLPPLDDTWVKKVQSLPTEEQVKEVAAELKRRNPGFDGKVDHRIGNGVVTQFSFTATHVSDLSPVRALTGLRRFYTYGPGTAFTDLSPLKGMRLEELSIPNSRVIDLSPLKGMPLTRLECFGTPIADLTPLKGMPLTYLLCHHTSVADLAPLKGMALTHLHVGATKVTDLSPLQGMPLQVLVCDFDLARDAEIVRSIKALETINGQPKAEALKGAVVKATFPPLDPAWVKKVHSLPAEEQVKEVAEEMKRRNLGFDGRMDLERIDGKVPFIHDGMVTSVHFSAEVVVDISPLQALPGLKGVACLGHRVRKGKLIDLRPLRGMKLETLDVSHNPVSDLSPLAGMPLKVLACWDTNIADLAPLKGMALGALYASECPIADFSILNGMPVVALHVKRTSIRDLTQMRGLPLRELILDFNAWRDTELLKSFKHLTRINGKPATDFWKQVDAERATFDAWAAKVAKLPPAEQVKEVAAELVRRNPGFNGKFNPVLVNNGMVESLGFNATEVTDLSPVRALPNLKKLICINVDPVRRFLPNNGPPARLADLWPLKGLKLIELEIQGTQVADLSPLKEMPLSQLNCRRTKVSDLTPLTGVPLKHLWGDVVPARDTALLRGIKTLEQINGKPAAEFFKDFDQKK